MGTRASMLEIGLLNTDMWRAFYVPGTVLDSGDISVNKTVEIPTHMELKF